MLKATKTIILVLALALSPLLTVRGYALEDYSDECTRFLGPWEDRVLAECVEEICKLTYSLAECIKRAETNPCTEEEWQQIREMASDMTGTCDLIPQEAKLPDAPESNILEGGNYVSPSISPLR